MQFSTDRNIFECDRKKKIKTRETIFSIEPKKAASIKMQLR